MPKENLGWHLSVAQRRERLEKLHADLCGWRDRFSLPLTNWTFSAPGAEQRALKLGDPWPSVDHRVAGGPVVFETTAEVPGAWVELPVELRLDVGGEGLVTLSTGARGGLNPYHRAFPVEGAAGQRLGVRVEAVPKGLFGSRNLMPRLAEARLVVPEIDVRALLLDLEVLLEALRELAAHDAAPHLLAAAEGALANLAWPSRADEYFARLDPGVGWSAADLWNLPSDLPAPSPLGAEHLAAVRAARESLRAGLARVRALVPPSGELALSGHAHLDLGWLWPVAETKRKGRRTFETVLGLMARDADFTFNQSSAQLYAWMEELHPDLFARVAARVREGRIEAVGGMWVEPDGQMPGGESWARQLLYGQRYFQQKFGARSTVAWLPDTFGFTPALPQLLLAAGITGFFTTKLSWNETTRFPHDLFWWEGLDGSRVLAHCFWNTAPGDPGLGSYNGDIAPAHLHSVWRSFQGKKLAVWGEGAPASLFTFGYGDGGGGPSFEMLERFARLKDFPALPRLRHSRVDAFFQRLPRDNLPVWSGELYLELHRGTLASHGRIKKLHRAAEHRLLEAEAAASLAWLAGGGYPGAALEGAWKTLLLNQFHDILPGSSIREVNEVAEAELAEVVSRAAALRDDALRALCAPEDGTFSLVNVTLEPRPLRAVLPVQSGRVRDEDGRELPAQSVPEGLLVVAPEVLVPPLGAVTLRLEDGAGAFGGQVEVQEGGGTVTLRSDLLEVEVAPDGTLARVFDRAAARDVLAGPGNALVVFRDVPRAWEAWDVAPDMQQAAGGEALRAEALRVLERGPLRAAVEVTYRFRDSSLTQTYRLTAGSRRLEVHTRAHWSEKRVQVRAFFPLNVRAPFATFETAFGAQTRPTHRNTPGDVARFEVSAHRWADLSESGYGVSLLNDGRYAHTALGHTLALTLLRAPVYPDPFADLGEHEFTYALLPHTGAWDAADTVPEAFDLNSPLLVTPGKVTLTGLPRPRGLPVRLGSLKRSEDGAALLLRLYEGRGARGEVKVELPTGWRAEQVNVLEDRVENADARAWPIKPFEIVSLRLTPPELPQG